MSVRRLAREEIGDRGSAIYASKLRPLLEPQCRGQFVAIDVETEDYEVAVTPMWRAIDFGHVVPMRRFWSNVLGIPPSFTHWACGVGHDRR